MNSPLDEVKDLVLALLGHDRWNSGLTDERLAERIALMLDGRGILGSEQPVRRSGL
jgi:hypothetical protein